MRGKRLVALLMLWASIKLSEVHRRAPSRAPMHNPLKLICTAILARISADSFARDKKPSITGSENPQ